MDKTLVGKVLHYYNKAGVAVVELSGELKAGDRISIVGGESFEQAVESMQIEHKVIPVAKNGQCIGLKVANPVREGYQVYKIIG